MGPESLANGTSEEVWTLNTPLAQSDPEVEGLIKAEKARQRSGLEMIASENFTSLPVLECMSSCLNNKYIEGQPGQRYYGGNQYIDQLELLTQKRALELYNLSPEEWGVNVQAYSGSPANFAVYTALVEPHGRIMGLDLPDGGHLTHGFYTNKTKVSATSVFFESMPYKTLRGPRAGLIFYRRGVRSVDNKGNKVMYDIENKINLAVFPGLQGGPHNHAIAGIAVAMKQAKSEEFKTYQRQVVKNAQRLAEGLIKLGYNIVTGGTDCHIVHVDLKRSPVAISGAKGELVLEEVNVSCNKNTVPGDKSALNPSGVRLGTPALTTRGFKEAEMDRVVALIDSALKLAVEIQASSGPKLVDFKAALVKPENEMKLTALRNEVESFAVKFRLPGQEVL